MIVHFNNPLIPYYIEDFEKLGKINLLQGNSGSGKSTFIDVVSFYTEEDDNMMVTDFYDGEIPLYPLLDDSPEGSLKTLKRLDVPHLVLIDEENRFIKNGFLYLKDAIHTTKHKYMVITRQIKDISSIPIDSRNVFIIEYDSITGVNYIRRRIKELYSITQPTVVDTAFVEDKESGYQFIKSYYKTMNVISVNGKNNLTKRLSRNLKRHSMKGERVILSILDLIGYSEEYSKYKGLVESYKQIGKELYTTTWKCFEEYILRSPNFKGVNTDICLIEEDYALVLSRVLPTFKYINTNKKNGYNKSSLGDCLSADYDCKTCELYDTCNIKVDDKCENYIHSDLQYIRERGLITQSSTEDEVQGF